MSRKEAGKFLLDRDARWLRWLCDLARPIVGFWVMQSRLDSCVCYCKCSSRKTESTFRDRDLNKLTC